MTAVWTYAGMHGKPTSANGVLLQNRGIDCKMGKECYEPHSLESVWRFVPWFVSLD